MLADSDPEMPDLCKPPPSENLRLTMIGNRSNLEGAAENRLKLEEDRRRSKDHQLREREVVGIRGLLGIQPTSTEMRTAKKPIEEIQPSAWKKQARLKTPGAVHRPAQVANLKINTKNEQN